MAHPTMNENASAEAIGWPAYWETARANLMKATLSPFLLPETNVLCPETLGKPNDCYNHDDDPGHRLSCSIWNVSDQIEQESEDQQYDEQS